MAKEGKRSFKDSSGYVFIECLGKSVYPTKEQAQKRADYLYYVKYGTKHIVRKRKDGYVVYGTC